MLELETGEHIRIGSWQGILCILLSLVAANIGWSILVAIQNLYLHPLRRFNGPKLWIAFPIFKSIAQLRGQLDFQIRQHHREYGNIVRLAPNELTFISGQAWKDIYGHGHAELPKIFPKGTGHGDNGRPSDIISSDARTHFRFRRAMLPAFSNKALDQQEPVIQVYVDLLIEKLRQVASEGHQTNMVQWYTFTTFDLIGDLAFGEPFDGLKAGKQNAWVSNIERMMRLFPILVLANASPLLSQLLLLVAGEKIKQARKTCLDLVKGLAVKRLEKQGHNHRDDFMDFMLRSQGEEHGLSNDELVANSDTLIVAGSETTATLLCGVTYYLLSTPEALEKCAMEVRNAFRSSQEISFKTASSRLPYMLPCLEEALRLFPPVPTVLFRHTLPGQVARVDGHDIPERVVNHQIDHIQPGKCADPSTDMRWSSPYACLSLRQ
jgi:cytochrome P450